MPRGKNKGAHTKYRPERNCWEVVEYHAGKLRRHATGFSSREDAEERLAEIIIARSTPRTKDGDVTLGELMAWYVQHHLSTLPRAISSYKAIERLAPYWGNLKLQDISKATSLNYLKYRRDEYTRWLKESGYTTKKELSGQTVRREIEVLQAAINFAHRENRIMTCPFIWKPEKSKPRSRWLTRKEAASLLNTARTYPRVRAYAPLFILIGLYTGARSEAILKLRWTDINFDTNRIDFTRIYQTHNKKGGIIPIPRKLRGHLLRHRKTGVQLGYVLHRGQGPIASIKNSFSSICEKAGLEDVTPHTLRHTCVSWKVQNGVSFEKTGLFAGMSPQMVKEVYGHLTPDHLEDVANA